MLIDNDNDNAGGADHTSENYNCQEKPPTPTCAVGGYRNVENGCPADHPWSPGDATKLSTTCLAVSGNATAKVGADFHCVLTCDREMSATAKDPEADAACPRGARCVVGHTRLLHTGVCLYE